MRWYAWVTQDTDGTIQVDYYIITINCFTVQQNKWRTGDDELKMMNWRILKYWQSASTTCLQPLDLLNKQLFTQTENAWNKFE